MIKNAFQNIELSALGLGCMRFPVIDGNDGKIDEMAAFEMIDYAMAHGVNYYDTAWGYHGGNSQIVTGKALGRHLRESYYLANKFPGYDLSTFAKKEEIFEAQLKKCGVDYFDFYLFHNVCEMNINAYLDEKFGIYDYLMEQKRAGKIRHLGFSTHGTLDTMKRFLEAYGKDMEFCQIQLNWLDWDFQDAKTKVELLGEWNIPIWVMEPMRGGRLVNIGEEHERRLKELRPDMTMAKWAHCFLHGIDGVTVTLTGASCLEQLKENIEIYAKSTPLSEDEVQTLFEIAKEKTRPKAVPCTACNYCTSHCPLELGIPRLISLYNEHNSTKDGFIAPMAIEALEEDKRPTACIGCRSCEAVCPQGIKISEVLADFCKKLK